jgi:hypothetical protein
MFLSAVLFFMLGVLLKLTLAQGYWQLEESDSLTHSLTHSWS